jgi:DNA-binding CsgD family transcriptional regulator
MLDSTNALRRREMVALLASRGVPTVKIASKLGVPATVIRADRLALSLPSPESLPAEQPAPEILGMDQRREEVRRLCAQDMYDREIAKILGVSSMTVIRDRKALGIKPKKNPDVTVERRREVARLVSEGMNRKQIAKALGVHHGTVVEDCNALFGRSRDLIAQRKELVRGMLARNTRVAEIAETLGVAEWTVRRYMKDIAAEAPAEDT